MLKILQNIVQRLSKLLTHVKIKYLKYINYVENFIIERIAGSG